MQVCLLKFGNSIYFFSFINTLNQMYLPRFSKAYRHVSVLITLGLLLMFCNLTQPECNKTPASYQVLPMQIRLVNNLR
jgi:hypothetical protein